MAGFIMRQYTWLPTNWKRIDPSQPYTTWDPGPLNKDYENVTANNAMTTVVDERAQITLRNVARMLVDTGTGWQLDPDHYTDPGKDLTDIAYGDIKELPAKAHNSNTANSGKVYAIYMKSVTQAQPNGEKLFLGYAPSGVKIRVSYGYTSSASDKQAYALGLLSSMLPANSSDRFTEVWDEDGFLPMCATPIHSSNFQGSTNYNMVQDGSSTNTYHIQVVTNGHIVSFRIYANTNMGAWWFTGPLVGTLAHPDVDTAVYSRLADFSYIISTGSNVPYEAGSSLTRTGTNNTNPNAGGSNNANYFTWRNPINNPNNFTRSCLFNAVGDKLKDSYKLFWDSPSDQLMNTVSDSSIVGFNRWVAIYLGVCSSDPSTTNIVRGDGMKGYFDTNFLRHVRATYQFGQTFDDGNFVYVNNGLVMGWDPSNGPLNAS